MRSFGRVLLLRRFSSSSKKYNFRGELKRVYMRVHPDRLNNEMSQDKIMINQNSLAVLNDFVDTVQTKCNTSRGSSLQERNQKHRFDMVFYYKDESKEEEERRGVVKLRIPKTLSGVNRWRRYAERSARTIEMSLGLRDKEEEIPEDDDEDEDRPVRRRPRRTTSKMTQSLMKRMGFDKDSIQRMEREIRSNPSPDTSRNETTRSRDRAVYEDKIVTKVIQECFEKTNGETRTRLYNFLTRNFDTLDLDSKTNVLIESSNRIHIGNRFSSSNNRWEIPLTFRDSDLLDFFRFQRERAMKREERRRRRRR